MKGGVGFLNPCLRTARHSTKTILHKEFRRRIIRCNEAEALILNISLTSELSRKWKKARNTLRGRQQSG